MTNDDKVYLDQYNRIYKIINGVPYCWNFPLSWQRAAMYSTKEELFSANLTEIDPAQYGCDK